ncbi:MAG: PQQ-like beta-propeller repeat protein [Planctomycetia bacterium]|nr:PQQ-like beta-propeller repeat protein [Planctomycetia bacterium]
MKRIMIRNIVCAFLFCGLILSVGMNIWAADWPCWRGANRNGLSSETGLLRNWTEESMPALVWKNTTVGPTMNGMAVIGNLVYTIGSKGGSECVFCIDNQSGKTLWSRPIGKPLGQKGKFPVLRSTPTFYKDLLYVMSSSGNLVCLNAADGRPFWTMNLVMNLGGILPQGGYCESPYVDGKWVIVTPGGPNATMVALDRTWRMIKWTAKTGMPAAYSSIMKASFGREHQYVNFTGEGVLGVKVKGGDVRWRYEAPAHQSGFNACPPIWFGQTILASSAVGTGCVWIQKDGTAYKTSEVWFNEDIKVPTGEMIKVNDNVFACTDEDGLVCFNYRTGEKIWTDQTLFAEAFEEDVDDVKSGSKSKKSKKSKVSALEKIPATVSINSPLLAQLSRAEGNSEDNAGETIQITPAPKARKKSKKAVPPPAPVCMGTFAYAEGLLYLRTSMGELVLLEASPEGFKPRGRIALPQMKKGLAVTPVIANGYLYLREGGTIFCFDLRDQSRKDGSDGSGSGGVNGGGNEQKVLPGMPDNSGTKRRTAPKLG